MSLPTHLRVLKLAQRALLVADEVGRQVTPVDRQSLRELDLVTQGLALLHYGGPGVPDLGVWVYDGQAE